MFNFCCPDRLCHCNDNTKIILDKKQMRATVIFSAVLFGLSAMPNEQYIVVGL